MRLQFFATASRGTEQALADELRALGLPGVSVDRGGVKFGERLEHAYRACLWSRVASRVLLPLSRFEADGAEALYEGVKAIDWTAHVGPEKTLAVDVAGGRSPVGPPHFVALKTKDAIVDRVRMVEGARPDVDTARPDVRVNVHLASPRPDGPQGDRPQRERPTPASPNPASPWPTRPLPDKTWVTVSLDLAGRGLHRRGIGRAGAGAPLKENLAAAVLALAGWPGSGTDRPLFDPLCGSGTLLVEAAWMALDVAPGLERGRIGAEGWRGHDGELWQSLRAEARDRRKAGRRRALRLAGSDASPSALRAAANNLERAGLENLVRLETRELGDVEPPWPDAGVVVTNPPYGERLGESGELGPFYQLLGDVLKRRFPGWQTWVLCGNPALAKRIGLRPASRHVLYNGPIECRLLEIPIAAAPVTSESGPGWRKPSAEAAGFAKKLVKNRRRLAAWAKRESLTCYRLYDTDMPAYNMVIDWYDGAVRVEEYERPGRIPAAVAERRLQDALLVVPEALGVEPADIVLRQRRRRAPGEQHERRDDKQRFREVKEGDMVFLVNLTDYLDTGLFLDDRRLRLWIRKRAEGVDFLNLFAYTCTASVAAAIGGARSTTSIDLSNPYLAWGRRNFAANGIELEDHRFIRADVLDGLTRGGDGRRYDLIFVAPPTYSRSKAMQGDFDILRDHARLLAYCGRLLKPEGEILFSANLKDFELDEFELEGFEAREITEEIIPRDFARSRLKAWVLRRR